MVYTSGGVTVSKLDLQTYTSEFESHWALCHIEAKSFVNYYSQDSPIRKGYDYEFSDWKLDIYNCVIMF